MRADRNRRRCAPIGPVVYPAVMNRITQGSELKLKIRGSTDGLLQLLSVKQLTVKNALFRHGVGDILVLKNIPHPMLNSCDYLDIWPGTTAQKMVSKLRHLYCQELVTREVG